MSTEKNTFNLGDSIDKIKLLIKFYFSNYTIIAISIAVSLFFATLYYVWEKPKYQADATFVLMESGGSKGGSLASLTSQFGIDIGSMSGQNNIFSGDNVFDIFKSRIIIENTLLSIYPLDSTKTLADIYYQNLHKRRFLTFLQNNNSINFKQLLNTKSNRERDSILNELIQNIILTNIQIDKLNKKSSIIKLTITSTNESFSKIFEEKLLENVKTFYVNIKNSNTQLALIKLQKKADSLQYELGGISLETFKNSLPAPTSMLNENLAEKINKEKKFIEFNFDKTVNSENIQRRRTITYTLFAEVIKNLELTKLTLAQQTPIFQILDMPKFPLYNSKMRLKNLLFIGLIVGIVISVFISFVKFIFK